MGLTRKRLAVLLVMAGAAAAIAGVGMIYRPAAWILGGIALAGIGLMAVRVE